MATDQCHVKLPHCLPVYREPRRPRLHLPSKAESDRAVVLGKWIPKQEETQEVVPRSSQPGSFVRLGSLSPLDLKSHAALVVPGLEERVGKSARITRI